MAIGYKCGQVGEGCGIIVTARYKGPCQNCGGWYSIKEVSTDLEGAVAGPPPRGQITSLSDISNISQERISTGFPGVDRIFGVDGETDTAGIAAAAGQATQLFGAPGAGKSTWLLQVCQNITRQRFDVLYVAGEESLQQIKTRADRIGKFNSHMQIVDEQDLDRILRFLDDNKPTVAVVDSIQTITVENYTPGSLAAMTTATRELYKFTQQNQIGLIVVVQMNKAGDDFAGPKALEHTLDTSLYMGIGRSGLRKISCESKNRFGITPASQLFEMTDAGLFEIEEPPEEIPPPESPPTLQLVP